jgi:hypothetical protein
MTILKEGDARAPQAGRELRAMSCEVEVWDIK